MRQQASSKAIKYLLVLSAFITLVTAVSLFANLQKVETQYRQLAAVVARSCFQTVGAMGDWNLRNGGVYLPLTPALRDSELLQGTSREIRTRGGGRLAKVDHAQMVRLVAGLLASERGIRVRIAALDPGKQANAPFDWEKEALQEFGRGVKEAFGVAGPPDRPIFRFMAPLKAVPSCAGCHRQAGDRPDEIRGGVSISFSWVPFQRLMEQNNRQIWILHLLFLAVSFLLIFLIGRKLVFQINALHESMQHIRRLEGLVPICANCKKIRNEGANPFDQSSWTSIERYISDRTDAEFTHGLCPECAKRLYPGVDEGKGESR